MSFSSYKSSGIFSNLLILDYKDENGYEIENRFGYFKNSLLSNISKFENMPDDLYEENDIYHYDWLNAEEKDEENFELWKK